MFRLSEASTGWASHWIVSDAVEYVSATCARSVMSNSATLWTIACQAALSMGFSRQGYWIMFPIPPPGNLPGPGIEPVFPTSSALQVDSLLLSHWGNYPNRMYNKQGTMSNSAHWSPNCSFKCFPTLIPEFLDALKCCWEIQLQNFNVIRKEEN